MKGTIEVQNMLRYRFFSVPNACHNLLSETLQRNNTSVSIPALKKSLKQGERETGSKHSSINSTSLFPIPSLWFPEILDSKLWFMDFLSHKRSSCI